MSGESEAISLQWGRATQRNPMWLVPVSAMWGRPVAQAVGSAHRNGPPVAGGTEPQSRPSRLAMRTTAPPAVRSEQPPGGRPKRRVKTRPGTWAIANSRSKSRADSSTVWSASTSTVRVTGSTVDPARRLNANGVNDDAAGSPSSQAATAPRRQAASRTIGSGRTRRGSASTPGRHGRPCRPGRPPRDRGRRVRKRLAAPAVEVRGRAGGRDLVTEGGRGVVTGGVAAPDSSATTGSDG